MKTIKYKKAIVFLFLIFSSTSLFGASSESKILKVIFGGLYHNSNSIKTYSNYQKKVAILKEAHFIVVQDCSNANIVYASSYPKECVSKEKPFFTDNYKVFKNDSNAIGTLYWKKGRPNIIFLKSRLKKFDLALPKKFKKYELDEL